MKINKKLTFAALAALAVALVVQTSTTQADAQGQRDDHGQQAKITFTKYVNTIPNLPGLMATVTGVGEGDAGDVLFEGEVLKTGGPRPPGEVVAMYHFTGTKHSFSALIQGLQPVGGVGAKGTIIGVVTDGWLKGHALTGEWTVIAPCYTPGSGFGNCFEVTLSIARDSRDSSDN